MEEAIKKAIEGGYKNIKSRTQYRIESVEERIYVVFGDGNYSKMIYCFEMFLDPLFWRALGKAMGWDKPIWHCNVYNPKANDIGERGCASDFCHYAGWKDWKEEWHRFINHLIEGKPAEEFFTNLLKK